MLRKLKRISERSLQRLISSSVWREGSGSLGWLHISKKPHTPATLNDDVKIVILIEWNLRHSHVFHGAPIILHRQREDYTEYYYRKLINSTLVTKVDKAIWILRTSPSTVSFLAPLFVCLVWFRGFIFFSLLLLPSLLWLIGQILIFLLNHVYVQLSSSNTSKSSSDIRLCSFTFSRIFWDVPSHYISRKLQVS